MRVYNPTDIGDRNKLSILRMVKNNDGISRQELSKRLHLSAPAVSNNVALLIDNGIIFENGCDDTSLGRKPKQLSYNANLYHVISVEILPGSIRGGIADLYGNILHSTKRSLNKKGEAKNVIEKFDEVIDELLEKKPKEIDVITMTVGVPSLTGQDDNNDLLMTYFKDWKNNDLENHILNKYKFETNIVNDVELALLGEREKGVVKDQKNILYIKYGVGFAARAIVDGYLLKGHNMAAGELGYYIESANDVGDYFVCPGRFEKKICNDDLQQSDKHTSLTELINAAENGDIQAKNKVDDIIKRIAAVIANTVLMLNSEIVILGGDSEIFNEENINIIQSLLDKVCPFSPKVAASGLGVDAPIYGGIKVALDTAEEKLNMLWKSK